MAEEVGSLILHIPHKDWNPDKQETQNYDEIERWSLRLPRGILGSAEQHAVVNVPLPVGSAVPYVSLGKSINFEVGRQYRIEAQWPGIGTSGAYGDVMFIAITLVAQPTSVHPAGTTIFFMSGTYNVISQSTNWQGGGSEFAIITPTPQFNGLFIPAIYADMRTGGPGQILGSPPPGAFGTIVVEDLGVVP